MEQTHPQLRQLLKEGWNIEKREEQYYTLCASSTYFKNKLKHLYLCILQKNQSFCPFTHENINKMHVHLGTKHDLVTNSTGLEEMLNRLDLNQSTHSKFQL
jgi:hypothetical protein